MLAFVIKTSKLRKANRCLRQQMPDIYPMVFIWNLPRVDLSFENAQTAPGEISNRMPGS